MTEEITNISINLNGLIKLALYCICNLFIGIGVLKLTNTGFGFIAIGIGFFGIALVVESK